MSTSGIEWALRRIADAMARPTLAEAPVYVDLIRHRPIEGMAEAAAETISVRADQIVAVAEMGSNQADVFLATGPTVRVTMSRTAVLDAIAISTTATPDSGDWFGAS